MPNVTSQTIPGIYDTYDPAMGEFSVLITCEGHASRRWKGARNAAEADALNQRLSEQRARVVYDQVKKMVEHELPGFPIALRERAVGSRKPVTNSTDNNAAAERCVAVMVDLVWTRPGAQKVILPQFRKVWPKYVSWKARVINYVAASLLVAEGGYVRIGVTPDVPPTVSGHGKEVILAGFLYGVDLSVTDFLAAIGKGPMKAKQLIKDFFKIRRLADIKKLKDLKDLAKATNWAEKILKNVSTGQTGSTMSFTTPPMSFDDWGRGGNGQPFMILRGEIKYYLAKSNADYIIFDEVKTDPGMLEWAHNWIQWYPDTMKPSWDKAPDVGAHILGGTLSAADIPRDVLMIRDWSQPTKVIDTHINSVTYSLIYVAYPTGESEWRYIHEDQRRELRMFVKERAAAIRARCVLVKPVPPRI
jgi:hypothetical protein